MDHSPERKSDYAKRVLFGGGGGGAGAPSKAATAATAMAAPAVVEKHGSEAGGGNTRSGSHSSTSSAPSAAIYSVPGTPRSTLNNGKRGKSLPCGRGRWSVGYAARATVGSVLKSVRAFREKEQQVDKAADRFPHLSVFRPARFSSRPELSTCLPYPLMYKPLPTPCGESWSSILPLCSKRRTTKPSPDLESWSHRSCVGKYTNIVHTTSVFVCRIAMTMTGMSSSFLRTPSKAPTSSNAALSVFLRVRPPGTPDADLDKLSGRRTYQIMEEQTTLRTFPPLSAAHSRTINRQVLSSLTTKNFP